MIRLQSLFRYGLLTCETPQLDFGVQEIFFKAVPEYSPMFTSVGQVFMKSIKNVILNSKSSLCALQGMNDKHRLRTQDKLRWWSQGNLERASTNHEKNHIPEAWPAHLNIVFKTKLWHSGTHLFPNIHSIINWQEWTWPVEKLGALFGVWWGLQVSVITKSLPTPFSFFRIQNIFSNWQHGFQSEFLGLSWDEQQV